MATAPDPKRFAAALADAEERKELRYVVSVGEDEWTLRIGELSARDVQALRKAGVTVSDLLTGVSATIGALDLFAAAVWMARRQAGDQITYDECLDYLTLELPISSRNETEPEPEEQFPDPPA